VILVVNTAEEALQLVLAGGQAILEGLTELCAGRMNEVMAPAAQTMLSRSGGSLDAVACVRGPGSFTGLRLGLAFCHGLCLARNIPMAGLDYMPLLAASAPAGSGEVHVVTHSRRGQVYHQAFGPDALGPPAALTAQAARDAIAARAAKTRVTALGTGLRRNPDVFADLGGAVRLDLENPTHEALLAAANAATFDGPPVEALYLRGSDAEENLAAIAAGRGLTEEEALAWMERATKQEKE